MEVGATLTVDVEDLTVGLATDVEGIVNSCSELVAVKLGSTESPPSSAPVADEEGDEAPGL